MKGKSCNLHRGGRTNAKPSAHYQKKSAGATKATVKKQSAGMKAPMKGR